MQYYIVWGVIWEHVWGCLIGWASFFANLMCFLYVQFRPFWGGGALFERPIDYLIIVRGGLWDSGWLIVSACLHINRSCI